MEITEYDYILTGFGTCASTLAYILGRDRNISVLIIEQGSNELNNRDLILNPYGVFNIQNFPNICKTLVTNAYKEGFDTRLSAYIGTTWGGGNSINYQVYDRGSRYNWDQLKQLNPVFDYDMILEQFWKKIENYSCSANPVSPVLHGFNGKFYLYSTPITILTNPLATAFQNVLQIPFSTDNNGNLENGTFPITIQQNIDCSQPDIFERSSMTLGYTQNIVNPDGSRKRPFSLTVKSNCFVDKIDIDPKSKKARGVFYISSSGCRKYVRAKKLVIVSAGALSSPTILQRSGVGSEALLSNYKIPVVLNNPNVGTHLKMHTGFTAVFTINKKVFDKIIGGKDNYLKTPIISYFSLTENSPPRKCYIHILGVDILVSQPSLLAQIENSYDKEKYGALTALCFETSPETSGYTRISGRSPLKPIDIRYDAFSDPRDLEVGQYILRTLEKVISQLTVTESGELIEPTLIFPRPEILDSPEKINDYLKSTTYLLYHYYGSCRMSNDASLGVVDSNMMVHGIKNLMVADGSVFFNGVESAGPSGMLSALGYSAGRIIKQKFGDGVITF